MDSAALSVIAGEAYAAGVRAAVTNLRRVVNAQVRALSKAGLRVVCLDEWGRRRLDADVVINNTPVPLYHRYASSRPGFRLLVGPAYLSLAPAFEKAHRAKRDHAGPLRRVLVSMGGVDRSGATRRLVEFIRLGRPDIRVDVVIGPGFPGKPALRRVFSRLDGVHAHEGLADLSSLLLKADAVVTAGGNTLIEAACCGTPAIVAYEDPHEREQGRALEKSGFGIVAGRGIDLSARVLASALDGLDDARTRRRLCQAGKRLADGAGARRIADVILRLSGR